MVIMVFWLLAVQYYHLTSNTLRLHHPRGTSPAQRALCSSMSAMACRGQPPGHSLVIPLCLLSAHDWWFSWMVWPPCCETESSAGSLDTSMPALSLLFLSLLPLSVSHTFALYWTQASLSQASRRKHPKWLCPSSWDPLRVLSAVSWESFSKSMLSCLSTLTF